MPMAAEGRVSGDSAASILIEAGVFRRCTSLRGLVAKSESKGIAQPSDFLAGSFRPLLLAYLEASDFALC